MKLVKLKMHFFPFPFMLDIKNELINLNVWSGRVMMIWNIILYMKINTFILDNRNLRFCFSKSFSSSKEEIYFSIQFACTQPFTVHSFCSSTGLLVLFYVSISHSLRVPHGGEDSASLTHRYFGLAGGGQTGPHKGTGTHLAKTICLQVPNK